MSPARQKIHPRKSSARKPVRQRRASTAPSKVNPNVIKLVIAGIGLILLSVQAILGIAVLVGLGIHHFGTSKKR